MLNSTLVLWAFGTIFWVLLAPIVGWQAFVRGRHPGRWTIASLGLGGWLVFVIWGLGITANCPSPQDRMRSRWPQVGFVALALLAAIMGMATMFVALVWASGLSLSVALSNPPW